jgi:PKHD-type hydroxylase
MYVRHNHAGQILTTAFSSDWYRFYPAYFSPDQVRRIRTICEKGEEEDAKTYGSKGLNPKVRKNKISWHSNEELFGMISPLMSEANQSSGWNIDITAIEPCQYTIYYDDNNHYHWHSDTIVEDAMLQPGAQGVLAGTVRKVSCVIQLTDPSSYEGGEFEFLQGKERDGDLDGDGFMKYEPFSVPQFRQLGTVLFFQSQTFHRVKPVKSGTRRSLVCWFRGPPWR